MIEISLIKDKTNYTNDQLDAMENILAKNFILHNDEELEIRYKPTSPEIRIYFKFTTGVIPEVILRAIGQDITKTISNNNFLNSFLNTNSNVRTIRSRIRGRISTGCCSNPLVIKKLIQRSSEVL